MWLKIELIQWDAKTDNTTAEDDTNGGHKHKTAYNPWRTTPSTYRRAFLVQLQILLHRRWECGAEMVTNGDQIVYIPHLDNDAQIELDISFSASVSVPSDRRFSFAISGFFATRMRIVLPAKLSSNTLTSGRFGCDSVFVWLKQLVFWKFFLNLSKFT